MTALLVASGTTFNSNGGTVKFNHTGLGGAHTTTAISAPVGFSLHNVEVGGSPLIFGYYDNFNSATTVAVSGNLLLAGKINNVNWDVSGNITVNGNALAGTGIINSLSGNTTLTHVATSQMPNGVFTVNKTAANNTLTFTSNVAFTGAAQPVTITQGTMDLAGFNLAVPGLLTIGANGKLICNGGTPSYGSLSVTGEMSCGPSLGITWTGNAGDNQWTTAGNWTNNTIPGSSDIAYFNSKCAGANCDVTMNSNVNVKGIVMSSSYAGTITQGAASTVTVGASGWTQVAGTFLGASSAITMDGPFALSGGTFRSTSGIMNINKSYSVTGAPTFTHNSGTLHITTASGGAIDNFIPGTVIYNHVDIHGYDSRIDFLGGTMTVAGDLTLRDSGSYPDLSRIYNATINVNGNITASLSGYGGSATTIRAVGNAAGQTITSATASSRIPGLIIAAGANNVTLSGNVLVIGTYTYTSSGIFTVTGSTLIFNNGGGGVSQSIVPGSVTYANVSFSGYDAIWDLGGGTLNVGDTLTINDTGTCCFRTVNNGTINASGNVSISGNLQGGSATLRIVGTTNQTVTGTSTAGFPVVEIASTGGTVTLAGTLRMIKNFTYTSGTIDAGTSTLWFDGYGGGPTGTIVSTAVPTFNNVTFGGYGANWTLSGTLAVGGTVRMEDTSSGWSHAITGGTILAYGSVVSSGTGMKGSAVLKLVGTANRTVSGNSVDAAFPSFEVATTAGTSTYSGTFSVYGDYIHTSGTIDPSTSRVMIAGNSYSSISIKPGTFSYNNFDIEGYVTTHTITGTLTVNGTLRLGGWSNSPYVAVNTGSIVANGDVTYYGNGLNGTTTLQFAGATNTILTAVAGAPMLGGTTTIGKSGGTKVSLAAATSFSTAGQDIVISGGTFDLAGFSLSVNDALTINSGATLKCSGGAFSNGGTLTNSGTINCPGYSGYEFNWTGAGGNSNWNTAGNWQGGNVPGVNDTPAFQDTYCGGTCNATMNVNVNVKGLMMSSPYTGTITQASGSTITVGSTGWTQAAGTFTGGNSDITISGGATLSGGTFTSTSGILYVRNNFSRTGTSFNHNNGTLRLGADYNATRSVALGALTVNNLEFYSQTFYDQYNLNLTGTVSVLGNLNIAWIDGQRGGWINGGTLNVAGNITSNNTVTGTVVIRATGSVNQTVTGTDAYAYLPNLDIASTGGTVTIVGTPVFYRSFVYTSGAVNFSTSTVTILGYYSLSYPLNVSALTFNNLTFGSEPVADNVTYSITGDLNVAGNLKFESNSAVSTVNGGAIKVGGNVSALGTGAAFNGNVAVHLVGSNAAQIGQTSGMTFAKGDIIVNKSGGAVVTQTSNIALGTAGQNLTVQAGTLNMAGYNLNVAGTLTNNSVLQRGSNPSCGTITAGTYSGTASICP